MAKTSDLDTCLHCRRQISFGPYYFKKGKVEKRWTHPEGMMNCSTKPEGWVGEWPKATPLIAA